ncbi:hypothetical protein JVT61DRAFT_6114 [Boletus reticuloceps]|uniref:Uncharacterized protein n=1 Tax=Boletus reticuloceps TaxID=495285 RepID=A0A8I2YLF2_9AGAM|nr:hypothetical protein JVT61DRAFT_6114 [Boletus reticuloceps]
MPPRPALINSPTWSIDGSLANEDFDFTTELESATTDTLIDPDEDLLTPAQSPIEFAYLYRHFHSLLHDQASFWSLVARRGTLILSRDIISRPDTLQMIMPSLLFPKIVVVAAVNAAIQQESAFSVPTTVSRAAFESASDGLREMVESGLQGVAYSYLTRVWHAILSLLHHPVVLTLADHFFLSLPHSPDEVLSSHAIDLIITNTTWDIRFGYRFWHVLQGEDRSIIWFANTTTRYLVHQTLADMSSGAYIYIPEVYFNPTTATSPQEVMLTNQGDSENVAERVAFVLAWIVVEMRALALSCYLFKHATVLTPQRVRSVAQEYMLINEFFSNVTAGVNAQHFAGRREALHQFLMLAPI